MRWSDDIEVFNMDCMEVMKDYPDNYFDLAVVDPPYGLNIAKEKPRKSGRWNYIPKSWDNKIPDDIYFKCLFEVAGNYVIWGGNYFNLPPCRCFLIWDKMQPLDNFADCEMAFTSFDQVAKTFRYSITAHNFRGLKRIHPTEKPIELYEWIFKNYAKPGDKILDTHLGSGSIAIALDRVNKIDKMNLTLVGCEIDKEYYEAAHKRFKANSQWQSIF